MIYLCLSKDHGSNVALVLNPETGKISPQYHLVFDNTFSTVHSNGQFTADVWDSLVASNVERHIDCETTFSGDPTVSETEFPVSRDLQREILPTVSPGVTTNTDNVPVPLSSEIDSELNRMFQRLKQCSHSFCFSPSLCP